MTTYTELQRAATIRYQRFIDMIEQDVQRAAQQGKTVYVQTAPFELTRLFFVVLESRFRGCQVDGISRNEFYIRWDSN
jgi:hypothetical protein